MTLTKKKMIREVGRRTRLKNGDVQAVLEVLIEVWTEELVEGGRIELENFLVVEVRRTIRHYRPKFVKESSYAPSHPRVVIRLSRKLKNQFKNRLRSR